MRLTVLGNNGPFQSAGGACSGYLLEEGGARILLDCGNGVLGNLLRFIKIEQLDAIIITHLHSDHVSDLMVLRYAIQIKVKHGMMNRTIDVYAPAEPIEEYNRLDIRNAFNLNPITDELVLNYRALRFSFSEMKHPVRCFAVSAGNGNSRFVYSGDTSWNDNIISFSKGADLLMLDAGLLSRDKKDENVFHLTARECGIIAREARTCKLLLTHFWPEYDTNEILAEARENFTDTEVTRLLHTYEIP